MATEGADPKCEDPQELFGLGVRAYILQDYEQAVEVLSKASELLAQKHKDDLHESLGKVYLLYGKSLLGSVRATIEPLGEAVPKGGDSDDSDAEDEGIEDEASEPKNSDEPAEVNGDPEEAEEDASDLELAWEVSELAKKIFEKIGDKRQMAEALIVLGEVSLESGNFETGIGDIAQGLELQKELFAKDSRTVAETLYKLGTAYSINSQMEQAIEHFQAAVDYLNNRIKTLDETKDDEEIAEIRKLLPDIEEKIAETRVYKDEAAKTIIEALDAAETKKTEDGEGPSPKPASDISHLVRRKRKLDEDAKKSVEAEEHTAKKPATDSK